MKKNFSVLLFCFGLLCNIASAQNGIIEKTNVLIDPSVNNFPKLEKESKSSFHLITHGRPGELLLGGKWLNAKEIAVMLKSQIRKSQLPVRHLNIYGCEFARGQIGEDAVQYLEKTLGVSVAASTNITGRDGDWILERGESVDAIALPEYQGNLQGTYPSCTYGILTTTQYATSATGNANPSWGNDAGVVGVPNIISSATDVIANRLSVNSTAATVNYSNPIVAGDTITMYVAHWAGLTGGFTVSLNGTPTNSGTIATITSAQLNATTYPYDVIKVAVPASASGSYTSIVLTPNNVGGTSLLLFDAISVSKSFCNPCAAGSTAPAITSSTITNTCPTPSVNLTTLTNTGTVPSGTTLVWSTHNPPTSVNDTLTTAQAAAVSVGGTYYAFYRSATASCFSPADTVTFNANIACCPYGVVQSYQYATSATGNGHADGTDGGIVGIPNVNNNVTDNSTTRLVVYNTAAMVQFAHPIEAGDTITIYAARHSNTVFNGDFTVSLNGTPSNTGVISTVTYSQITTIANNSPWSPYTAIQVIVPASATGSYSSINLNPTSSLTFTYVDAIRVSETYCNTCPSGLNKPTLTSSYYGFCSPATSYNLTTLSASNIPSGSTLSWHTGTPATSANEVTTPTSVTNGTYYAAIKTGTGASACYSGVNGDGTATTKIVIGKDSDCDGVPDSLDLDDDNDGISDITEMQSVACTAGVGQWRFDIYDEYENPNGGFYCPFWPTVSSWVSGDTINQYGSLNITTTNSASANAMLSSMGITNTGANNDPRWLIRFSKTVPLNSAPNQTLTIVNNSSNGDIQGLKINGISAYCYSAYMTCPLCEPNGTHTFTVQPGDVISYDITENDMGTNSYNTQVNLACSQLIDIDTDGDGIVNRLDLDSDGDGCSDAIEGGASFTISNLVNSSMAGGNSGTGFTGTSTSPVTSNLGNTIGSTSTTIGIPTIAGTGQTIGTSVNKNSLDSNCAKIITRDTVTTSQPSCTTCPVTACTVGDEITDTTGATYSTCSIPSGYTVTGPVNGCYTYTPSAAVTGQVTTCQVICKNGLCDTTIVIIPIPLIAFDKDGDGITDKIDLDDDNDGILDAIESPSCYYTANEIDSIVTISTGLATTGVVNNMKDGSLTTTFAFTNAAALTNDTVFAFNMLTPVALDTVQINLNTTTGIGSTTASKAKLQAWDGTTWVDLDTGIVLNGTFASKIINFPVTFNKGVTYQNYRILGASGTVNASAMTELTVKLPSDFTSSAYPKSSCTADTDGDGILNQFDLDSDGDGCSDAMEGGNAIKITSLVTSSLPGGNSGSGYTGSSSTAVTLNLGNTVGSTSTTMGVPTIVGSGQTIGSSQIKTTITCLDTDGDGYVDADDLDDDNDGILDSDESNLPCPATAVVGNGQWMKTEWTPTLSVANKTGCSVQLHPILPMTFRTSGTASDTNYFFKFRDAYGLPLHTATATYTATAAYLKGADNANSAQTDLYRSYGWINFPSNLLGQSLEIRMSPGGAADNQSWVISSDYNPTNWIDPIHITTGEYLNDFNETLGLHAPIGATGWGPMTSTYNSSGCYGLISNLSLRYLEDFTTTITAKPCHYVSMWLEDEIIGWDMPTYQYKTASGVWTDIPASWLNSTSCFSLTEPQCGTDKDTDSDGIPDRLDLDSDGDGCADAIEGGAGIAPTLLVNSSLSGGNTGGTYNGNSSASIIQNLGNTVGTTTNTYGVPVVVNTGQSLGTSENGNLKDIACITCTDTTKKAANCDYDGDGIINEFDLDDDNDGILDEVESPACYYTANEIDSIASISTGLATTGVVNNMKDGSLTTTFAFTNAAALTNDTVFAFNLLTPVALDTVKINLNTTTGIGTAATAKAKLQAWDGTTWVDLDTGIVLNGTFASKSINFPVTFNNGIKYQNYRILGTAGTVNANAMTELTVVLPSPYITSSYPKATCTSDTDGDGILNQFDLDSDGDGCADALEGGANLIASSIVTSSIPGGNTGTGYNGTSTTPVSSNLGNTVGYTTTTNGVPTLALAGQSLGYSQDKTKNACLDTDGDGVGDLIDIDDDNDGVLDNAEMTSCTQLALSNGLSYQILKYSLDNNTAPYGLPNTYSTTSNVTWGSDNLSGYSPTVTGTYIKSGNDPLSLGFSTQLATSFVTNNSNTVNYFNGATSTTEPDKNITIYKVTIPSGMEGTYTFAITSSDEDVAVNLNGNLVAGPRGYNYSSTSTLSQAITVNAGDVLEFRLRNIFPVHQGGTFLVTQYPPDKLCDFDTDNDGIPNRLDLDSDGDGCSDAKESGVTSQISTTSAPAGMGATTGLVNAVAAAPYSGNGFADGLQSTTDTNTYKSAYTYRYAISNTLNACADLDNDGVGDLIDLDDDNDGILDAIESPNCYYTQTEMSKLTATSSDMTWNSGLPYTNSTDGIVTTYSQLNAPEAMTNKTIVAFTMANYSTVNNLKLDMGGNALTNATTDSIILQGWNGSTWVNLSNPKRPTAVNATDSFTNTLQPNGTFSKVRLYGKSGNLYYANIKEAYLSFGNYVASANPKDSCKNDTDGDGKINQLDLDSDGDGCYDAFESGTVSVKTDSIAPAPYDGNGFSNSLQATTDTNTYKSAYTYKYANSKTLNLCADSDNDGVGDIIDLDDDNDGILDAIESPNCYYTQSEMSILTATASDMAWNTPSYDYTKSTDGTTTTFSQTLAPASMVNKTIVEYTMVNTSTVNKLKVDLGTYALTSATTDSIVLQGWNGSAWVNLSAPKTSSVANVIDSFTNTLQPTGSFSKVRLYGKSGNLYYANIKEAYLSYSNYVASANPKDSCKNDTDGDGIVNQLDLDSDGDGCSDAIEGGASFTTSNLASSTMLGGNTGTTYNGTSTTPVTSNLGNTVGSTATTLGVPTIAGTGQTVGYSQDKTQNACIDYDGDGIGDLDDLDDDNDGILDSTEGQCSINFSPSYLANSNITVSPAALVALNNTDVNPVTDLSESYVTFTSTNKIATFTFSTAQTLSKIVTYNAWGQRDVQAYKWVYRFYDASNNLITTSPMQYDSAWFPASPTTNTYNFASIANVKSVQMEVLQYSVDRIVTTPEIRNMADGGTWQNSVEVREVDFFTGCINLDTDKDGIPNYLDLDSDGDGCTDAIEGGANFTNANLVSSSLAGGNSGGTFNGTYTSPVTSNLGNTVGSTTTTLGVPTIAGTGQTVYRSQDKTLQDSNCVIVKISPKTETGTISTLGGVAINTVITNDSINNAKAVLGSTGNATVSQSGTWATGITLDTTSGSINVAAGTPAGVYPVTYNLCDKVTPVPNCQTVIDTVIVTCAQITVPTVSGSTTNSGTATYVVTSIDTTKLNSDGGTFSVIYKKSTVTSGVNPTSVGALAYPDSFVQTFNLSDVIPTDAIAATQPNFKYRYSFSNGGTTGGLTQLRLRLHIDPQDTTRLAKNINWDNTAITSVGSTIETALKATYNPVVNGTSGVGPLTVAAYTPNTNTTMPFNGNLVPSLQYKVTANNTPVLPNNYFYPTGNTWQQFNSGSSQSSSPVTAYVKTWSFDEITQSTAAHKPNESSTSEIVFAVKSAPYIATGSGVTNGLEFFDQTLQFSKSTKSISNTCPTTSVNLNTLLSNAAPAGTVVKWFTNENHTGTAYATPTTATAGTYYPFYVDSVTGCYSQPGAQVTVTINVCPTPDTVITTPACPSCPVTVCAVKDELASGSVDSTKTCGTPTGYSASTPDTNGCITYTPNGTVTGNVTTCIVACKNGICDTTYVTINKPVTPDTVVTTPACPTCPVTVCVVKDDLATGAIDSVKTCGTPTGYSASTPDANGCITYTPLTSPAPTGPVTTCIVACKNGICDTTLVTLNKPVSPDTVVTTPACPTCPVTVCAVKDDLASGSVDSTKTCGTPTGYTASTPDANGCITYTPNGTVTSNVTTCIVACKNGICDTTYITINKPVSPDTVVTTPACPTCPVTVCVVKDDLASGTIDSVKTCGTPTGYTASTPDANGCITYTPNGTVTGNVTTCIVACKNGVCDTTYVTLNKPVSPDTVATTLPCPTCPVTVCVVKDDLATGALDSVKTCGTPAGYTASAPDSNGCVTYTKTTTVTGVVTTCIVACKNGICDTTIVVISSIPSVDSITTTPACPTCPVTVCVVKDDLATGILDSVKTCGTPSGYTASTPDANGCIIYTPLTSPAPTGPVTTCIIACKNGVCDTTIVTLNKPISPDTVVTTPACPTCPVTVCAVKDDLTSGSLDSTKTCGSPSGYTASTPDANGCITYTPNGTVTGNVTTCIVACKNGICDTTYVTLNKPVSPDTVVTTPACPTCPTTVCVVKDDLASGSLDSVKTCGTPTGYTASTPDANGCITYTPLTSPAPTGPVTTCIVACKNGVCDTTYVTLNKPVSPDTVVTTPACPTCPVTVCVVKDDLATGTLDSVKTCGTPAGYTASTPDANGCITYTPLTSPAPTGPVTTCIIACKNGVCDTTIVTLNKPISPDTVVTTPACPTCPVTVCAVKDDLASGSLDSTKTCGTPTGYTASTPDANGCITYTPNGTVTGNVTTCIVACKNGICDTTYVTLNKPVSPDTVVTTPACPTCPVTVCVVKDDLATGAIDSVKTCGTPTGYSASTPDANGCITYTPLTSPAPTGPVTTCIVACKNGVCDTTYVTLNKPVSPDTVVTTPACPTCPVTVCVVKDDLATGTLDSVKTCGTPTGYTASTPDANGCITYTPLTSPAPTGPVTTCIVACKNGVCDTTYVTIKTPVSPDTVITTPACPTCPVTVCTVGDDISGTGTKTYSTCGTPSGYTVAGPDASGCYTYTPNGTVTTSTTTCQVVCLNGVCDTTYVTIKAPVSPDTVVTTPACPTCPVTVCVVKDDLASGSLDSVKTCGTPTGYTASTPDANGCITYTPLTSPAPTGPVTTCIVACKNGVCDTTYVTLNKPVSPDTVVTTPACPTCPVTVCVVKDDLATGTLDSVKTCGTPTGYTASTPDANGCITYTPLTSPAPTGPVTTCIVACKNGVCDTTYVTLNKPVSPDTVATTLPCPTCPVTVCVVKDDLATGALDSVKTCGTPAGYTASTPDANGCITYTKTTNVTGVVSTCIVACKNGICDTTYVIISSLPSLDSITTTPACPTCPVTVCVVKNDLASGTLDSVKTCGTPAGYTASTPDANGCVTYTPLSSPAPTGPVTTCIIACKNGVCDTTKVTLNKPVSPDTVVTTPACPTCPVTVCVVKDDLATGTLDSVKTCGTPTGYTASTPDVNGCITYTPNGPVTGDVTTCIVACKNGICDTTYVTINKPVIPDTVVTTPACPTCPVTVCAVKDDLASGSVDSTKTCGTPTGYTASTPDANGCITYTPNGTVTGNVTTCIVACKNGICDTTYVTINNPVSPDTVVTTPACPTCPVTVCAVKDDLASGSVDSVKTCGTPTGYTASTPDANGCITYTPNGTVTGNVTTCVVACKNGICDTTYVTIKAPVSPDTVVTTPACPTCPVTVCAVKDDLASGSVDSTKTCGTPAGYTASTPDANGCITYTPNGTVTGNVTTCVVACKNGICDTTYVTIKAPVSPDTVVTTPACPTCPVTVCAVKDDLASGSVDSTKTCGTPTGYTASTPDANGCITYTPNGTVTGNVTTCVVACKNGICDTTYVTINKPVSPDSVVTTPACPTCPVTVCAVKDDLASGSVDSTKTCGTPTGYTASTPDANGCITYTPNGTVTGNVTTCVVACKNGICDTTYITINKPVSPDTVVTTPACPACPVTVCAVKDDLATGSVDSTKTCGTPTGYTASTPDANGCITYTPNGTVTGNVTTCIVACKNGICDTTYVTINNPVSPDTVVTIPACPTCPVTVCAVKDDLAAGIVDSTKTCGTPTGYTASTPDANGCITYTPNGTVTGNVTTCIVACKNGICDTTYVTINKPVSPDTVVTTPACPTCPVTVCAVKDDLATGSVDSTKTCGTPTGYTASTPDANGCITYTPNGTVTGNVTTCIVACKNGICDTTYVTINKPVSPDTVEKTLPCPTCPVTICVVKDDLASGTLDSVNTCGTPAGYTATAPDANGCITYTPQTSPAPTAPVTTCIVACKNGICDTTYVKINTTSTPDTVITTPACPTCPVTVCTVKDDLSVGTPDSNKTCGTPAGYTATAPDANGCITYTPNGSVTGNVTTCIISCKNGVCDTTYVIINKPVSPDTVVTTPACPTCPVTVCSVKDDLSSGTPDSSKTCGTPTGYTAVGPDANGCITYTPNGNVTNDVTTCIVSCKNGICDTTYVTIKKPVTPDTVVVTPACATCPVTICAVKDDLASGTVDSTKTCGTPIGYTASAPDANGCITYTPNGTVTGVVTTCIVACKNGICDTTYVIINKPLQIVPAPDSGTITANGGTAITNITKNDSVNGVPAVIGTNSTVSTNGTWPSGIMLDISTGAVIVAPGTTPGVYTMTYNLCDKNTPVNCKTETVSVTVLPSIIPNPESGTVYTGGGTAVNSVLTNDKVNGLPATVGASGNATVSPIGTWPNGITLDVTTGAIKVASGTAPGKYLVAYELCDKLTPKTCATVIDTIYVLTTVPTTDTITTKPTDTITIGSPIVVKAGDTMSIIVIQPKNNSGIAIVNNSNAVITFVPNDTAFVGKDTIIKIVCITSDGKTRCDTTFIYISNPNVNQVLEDTTDVNTSNKFPRLTPYIFEGGSYTTTMDSKLSIDPVTGEVIYTPAKDFEGIDTVKITRCDSKGNCVMMTYIIHVVPTQLEIPNYFSPNGDGQDDAWKLPSALYAKYPNLKVIIYNRWGNIVWRSSGAKYEGEWHGQSMGTEAPLPDGVYYYLIELENEFRTTRTGFVEVMRR